MKRIARNFAGTAIAIPLLILAIWFASGLPRTIQLRSLSSTPGLLIYADETTASESYRKWASFIESCPMPGGLRKFFLQYCEARTSSVVLRSLHPVISTNEVQKLRGMEIVNFLDIQAGEDANQVIELVIKKAPNLRILHLQGKLNEDGLRKICQGLPNLEDLYIADATLEKPVPELETGLLKLQGMTFDNCDLGRGFTKSLETRPDVKIAHQ